MEAHHSSHPHKRARTVSAYEEQAEALAGDYDASLFTTERFDYPRRRAIIACDICRVRKSKCDGAKRTFLLLPTCRVQSLTQVTAKCKLCTELKADCVYREPGIKLDAGDKLILERLARIEGLVQSVASRSDGHSPAASTSTIYEATPTSCVPSNLDTARSNRIINWESANSENISTIPKEHTTPALNLLHWPRIRDLVSRPYDPQVLLRLEMTRPPLEVPDSSHPDMVNIETYVRAFFELVNVWYVCVSPYSWSSHFRKAASVDFSQGSESCLVLLVLALGCAAKSGSIANQPRDREPPGFDYFAAAWKIFPSLLIRNNHLIATQCHILVAAYLFYLVRPLEAWNILTNASVKLQLFLSATKQPQPLEKELSKRIFWALLITESNLRAELDLPHFGIDSFEETVGLPGFFQDTGEEAAGEDSVWWFLAEISFRRLLNRVSNLIYAKTDTTGPLLTSKLDRLAAELDFQLEQIYDGLPAPVKFSRGSGPIATPTQMALKLHYVACRTIIYRPYVLAVLSDESVASNPLVRENCRKCLEACIGHIENVRTQ